MTVEQRFLTCAVTALLRFKLGSRPINSLAAMALGRFICGTGGVAMSDLYWLSRAQMRRIEPYFFRCRTGTACRWPQDTQRDGLCDQERTSLARRAEGVWEAMLGD